MAAAVPAAARTCSRTDLDALQGAWVTVAGPREAKLLVAGNRFAVEFEDGTIYMGSFTLDPTDDPKRIDMRIEEASLLIRKGRHRDALATLAALDGLTRAQEFRASQLVAKACRSWWGCIAGSPAARARSCTTW